MKLGSISGFSFQWKMRSVYVGIYFIMGISLILVTFNNTILNEDKITSYIEYAKKSDEAAIITGGS